jgi:hypothetical protein
MMIDCPACDGPQALGGDCATCLGLTEVTQEIYDTFLAQKAKQEQFFEFVSTVNEKAQNGIDQTMSFTVGTETLQYTP